MKCSVALFALLKLNKYFDLTPMKQTIVQTKEYKAISENPNPKTLKTNIHD